MTRMLYVASVFFSSTLASCINTSMKDKCDPSDSLVPIDALCVAQRICTDSMCIGSNRRAPRLLLNHDVFFQSLVVPQSSWSAPEHRGHGTRVLPLVEHVRITAFLPAVAHRPSSITTPSISMLSTPEQALAPMITFSRVHDEAQEINRNRAKPPRAPALHPVARHPRRLSLELDALQMLSWLNMMMAVCEGPWMGHDLIPFGMSIRMGGVTSMEEGWARYVPKRP